MSEIELRRFGSQTLQVYTKSSKAVDLTFHLPSILGMIYGMLCKLRHTAVTKSKQNYVNLFSVRCISLFVVL